MKEHHKDQILKIVSYYMDRKLRAKVMMEAPVAYNAWVGQEAVDVVRTIDSKSMNEIMKDIEIMENIPDYDVEV